MEEQNCLLLDKEPPKKQQYKKRDIKIACYILLPWLLVLSFLIAVLFELYQKPIGIDDPIKDLPQKTLLSHKIREVQVDRLLTSDIDTSRDIVGQIRFGYGSRDQPCLTIFFEHTSEITVHAKVGPKAKFTQSQGNYTHNNQTGVWECHPTESMWWSITIKGEEHAQWTGDVTNEMLTSGKMGRSKTEIWYKTQSYGKILDPSLLSISAGDDDWTRVWNFQVERETALVKVSFVFTVTNSIAPEVRVNPRSVKVQEELEPIELQCGTRLPLPQEASLVWSKGKTSLGSFTNNPTRILHKGQMGEVHWNGMHFMLRLDSPTRKDSGIYECCVLLKGDYKHCDRANVSVWSPEDNLCTGTTLKPSNPFQVNYFQSKPLLRNGSFVTLVWTFNMTGKYPLGFLNVCHTLLIWKKVLPNGLDKIH
ncbi:uncharacterized protein LOC128473641 [Spea bombifrons]|uniref:uncharacterized protein LOC128473641 n=1 Tax=Spea bombifrons TaxID=233779 RepID=UPI002349255B|nr:uncharacterized protein LOC128473641 [Spea bombifrons]